MLENKVTIISAQGHISIQDLGRKSSLHLGFPMSGAADEYSYLSANYLLNNQSNTAALEVTFGQVSLTVNCNSTFIITGANCNATINNKPIKHWQVYFIKENDLLKLSAPRKGVYSYINFAGGIQTKSYLGSKSQLPIQLLVTADNILEQLKGKKQVSLPLANNLTKQSLPNSKSVNLEKNQIEINRLEKHAISIKNWQKNYQQSHLTLRFIPQPLWQNLPLKQQAKIKQQPYLLTARSNKMGYRLQGNEIKATAESILLSKPVVYGCIQIPPDGQPIVLMKDHQTIGGYPILGYVIKSDLFRLAQMRANSTISFEPVSLMQAQTLLQNFYQRFEFT